MGPKENFQIEENQRFDEFKNMDKEFFLPKEVGIKVDESLKVSEIETNNSESKKNDRALDDSPKNNNLGNEKKKKINSLEKALKRVSATTTTIVATGVVAAVLVTSIIYKPPTIAWDTFEYGANYLAYDALIDGLDNELDYTINLQKDEEIVYEKVANKGNNDDWIIGLTPNTNYTFNIFGYNETSGKTTYYQHDFSTLDASIKSAILKYKVTFEDDGYHINYKAYISNLIDEMPYSISLNYNGIDLTSSNDYQNNYLIGEFIAEMPDYYRLNIWENEVGDNLFKSFPIEVGEIGKSTFTEHEFMIMYNEVMIYGELIGSPPPNKMLKIIFNETNQDDTTHTSIEEVFLVDGNYISLSRLIEDDLRSLSYQLVLANETDDDEAYEEIIFTSEELVRDITPSVEYSSFTTTQNTDDGQLFDVTLYFECYLPNDSYYIVYYGDNTTDKLYTSMCLITGLPLGEYPITYQIFNSDETPYTQSQSFSINVELPPDAFFYTEYEVYETMTEVMIGGIIEGTLPTDQSYRIHLNVTSITGVTINLVEEIVLDEYLSFTYIYQKETDYDYLDYKIVLSTTTSEFGNYLLLLFRSREIEHQLTPNVEYFEANIIQNEMNVDSFTVELKFNVELPYGSYYVIEALGDTSSHLSDDAYSIITTLGTLNFNYQIFNYDNTSYTDKIETSINVSIPEGAYLYHESSIEETINQVNLTGSLIGNLPTDSEYRLLITETLDDNTTVNKKVTINNEFNYQYQKSINYTSFSYLIVVATITNADEVYETLIYTSQTLGRTLTPSINYLRQTIFDDHDYAGYKNVTLEFDSYLPYQSYYIISDGTNDSEKIYNSNYTYIQLQDGVNNLTYQLFAKDDTALTQKANIICEPISTSGYNYQFDSSNPSDVQITYNLDGTVNLYFNTNFNDIDNAGIVYEIDLLLDNEIIHFIRDTTNIACFENVAKEMYILNFKVLVVNGDVANEISFIYPSGTISYTE